MLWFFAGFLLGGTAGVFLMGLIVSGKMEDLERASILTKK